MPITNMIKTIGANQKFFLVFIKLKISYSPLSMIMLLVINVKFRLMLYLKADYLTNYIIVH